MSLRPTHRIPWRGERARRASVALGALLLTLLTLAPRALAHDVFSGNEGNGRIYDPERLRTPPTKASPGRLMKRPKIPDPPTQRPLHSSAVIPDPSPQLRGGSGFKRDGKYFYAEAQPATLSRKNENLPHRETIPNPEPAIPRHHTSAAEHMPGMSGN